MNYGIETNGEPGIEQITEAEATFFAGVYGFNIAQLREMNRATLTPQRARAGDHTLVIW